MKHWRYVIDLAWKRPRGMALIRAITSLTARLQLVPAANHGSNSRCGSIINPQGLSILIQSTSAKPHPSTKDRNIFQIISFKLIKFLKFKLIADLLNPNSVDGAERMRRDFCCYRTRHVLPAHLRTQQGTRHPMWILKPPLDGAD